MTELPSDPTLDEIRAALAPVIPAHAAFDGWGEPALARAAAELGIDPGQARLAYPDGALGMIDAWFGWIDAECGRRFPPDRIAAMKVRHRIRGLLLERFAIMAPHREGVRRALAVLAMPQNVARGARLGWRAADAMWRIAGDVATDLNHYSKRAILSAVYGATLLVWLDDESEEGGDTAAFLDRRLAQVLRFETLKARLRSDPERRFSMARFLGRLRYPVR